MASPKQNTQKKHKKLLEVNITPEPRGSEDEFLVLGRPV